MLWREPAVSLATAVARDLVDLRVWGALFALLGLLLMLAAALGRRAPLRVLHSATLGLYVGYVSAIVLAALVYGGTFATVGTLLVVVAGHVTVLRCYRRPPPGRHEPQGRE